MSYKQSFARILAAASIVALAACSDVGPVAPNPNLEMNDLFNPGTKSQNEPSLQTRKVHPSPLL
jgi:hypothetical protein